VTGYFKNILQWRRPNYKGKVKG